MGFDGYCQTYFTIDNCQSPNSTQWQINISWVWPENCFANPTTHHPPQKLNISNISAVTDPILKVVSCKHLEHIQTVTVTFVQATFVLTAFVHIRNISALTVKIGSWEHLEQIPTVMVTFVKATFVLATFVHIRNISALTDPILMKL